MVYRVYVEKKPGFDHEASALYGELKSFLGIQGLTGVRIINRYDVENIDEAVFEKAVPNVFSEPMLDTVSYDMPEYAGVVFAAEYLPGQFDQRADSAAQCIQLLVQCDRPDVRTATVYILEGALSEHRRREETRHQPRGAPRGVPPARGDAENQVRHPRDRGDHDRLHRLFQG